MLWVHFCTVGCRQMLIDCVIDFHSYSKISSLNSNNALILNGFKININLIFSMFMSLRPISAHCQNQYASCQDSKTLLSCSLTVPFINSFIQSFIYVINVCWFPIITVWHMTQWTIHLFWFGKSILFAVWKSSWKNVKPGELDKHNCLKKTIDHTTLE